MNKIVVSNLEIHVIKKDIKNIHLAVYPPHGRIRVAAPQHTHDDAIRLFIVSKIPWIKKHQKKFLQQKRLSKREYISGESHYFMGQRYLLNIIHADQSSSISLRNKKYLDLRVKPWTNREQKAKIFKERYRKELKLIVPSLLAKWQQKMWVQASHRRIQQMKTRRWSCNPETRRIILNLELAKVPPQCIEYVLVHELTHLLERTHNDKFVAYVDSFLPNWRQLRDILNSRPLFMSEGEK